MAKIHEHLYQADNFSKIDMPGYVNTISKSLIRLYAPEGNIKTSLKLENISLDITTAVPCGLILNEILTNAIKHGFPEEQDGTIEIKMALLDNNFYSLSISNDGRKLPANFSIEKSSSMGFTLIHLLTEQLEGSLTINPRIVNFTISFPVPA